MPQTIDQVWRDYDVDGVPASGNHNPKKSEIRTLLKGIQGGTDSVAVAVTAERDRAHAAETAIGIRINDVEALAATGVRSPKASVRLLVTVNVNIANALEAGDTVDGIVLVVGDRVALTGQTVASQNGVYIVQASGAAVRATDMDTAAELVGAFFSIDAGTHAGETWALTNTGTITVGTTALTFIKSASTQPVVSEVATARGGQASLSAKLGTMEASTAVAKALTQTDEYAWKDYPPFIKRVLTAAGKSAVVEATTAYGAYITSDSSAVSPIPTSWMLVWVVLSQSNGQGFAVGAPTTIPPTGTAYMWNGSALVAIADPTAFQGQATSNNGGAWQALANHLLREHGIGTILVNAAVGATATADEWSETGDLRAPSAAAYAAAKGAAHVLGLHIIGEVAISAIGESDAGRIDSGTFVIADVKAASLDAYEWIGTTMGLGDKAPILLWELGVRANGDSAGREQVRQMQHELVAELPNVFFGWTGGRYAPEQGGLRQVGNASETHYNRKFQDQAGESCARIAIVRGLGQVGVLVP
ncbi:hypothetical protein [Devosia sp. 2618]|uniref:hypothetical protein n=1 Tax=Devosia sp. 2618 TaxID=3156454 RepID=UPI003390E56F